MWVTTAPTAVTGRDDFRTTATAASPGACASVEVRVAVSDPFDVYQRTHRDADDFFYETTGGQPGWGAFGVDPAGHLTIDAPTNDNWGDSSVDTVLSLAALESLVDSETLACGDCDTSYPYDLFSWLSYGAARELKSFPEQTVSDRGLPHLQLGLHDLVASWAEPRSDDGKTTLCVTCCPVIEADEDLDVVYDEARARVTNFATEAIEGEPEPVPVLIESDKATSESAHGREAFAGRVRVTKRCVRDGDTFRANLFQRLVAPVAAYLADAYAALREVNPASYSELLELPGVGLVSASPELLLHVEGDRLVIEPIAGTRLRGVATEEDEALETDLATDEKERVEHTMFVDLERNSLERVSKHGSIEMTEYRRADRHSEVVHPVSLIEGVRCEGTNLADAITAMFPGGTITGVPKSRAMEIIDELEATRHGPYTGGMFAVGFDDRTALNTVIQTFVRFEDEYHLHVDAGVVHDSDSQREYNGTLMKARMFITVTDEVLGERANMAMGTER